MLTLAIIGGGAAGLAAGLYASRAGIDTVLFEGDAPGGNLTKIPNLENYPGAESVDGYVIASTMQRQAAEAGLKTAGERIAELIISKTSEVILKTEKNTYTAKCVIIATGTSSRKLKIPGENELIGRGVSYCATCDGPLFKNRRVVVVGGGNTAITDALYLSGFASSVVVVHRRGEFRATSSLLAKAREKLNIEFITNAKPVCISGTTNVTGITLERTTSPGESFSVETSAVFIAVGATPNTSAIDSQIERVDGGYIQTDSRMKTNFDFVFAAGDVRNTPLRQVITAASDGAIAAESAVLYLNTMY